MALSGDFIGFTFNGVHSSDMGIIRTSDGSRFNENLLPTFTDKTVQIPGGDGTYYFGSNYTQRQISISVATDELTETQFRQLKQWLGDKQIHPLVFDEAPYKTYMVKTSSAPTLKFICFDNITKNNNEIVVNRVYKGEGSLQFIAYFPFARCTKKYLSDYSDSNKEEWASASGLLTEQGEYDKTGTTTINLYNPGDLETDFFAYYAKTSLKWLTKIYIDSNILNFDFSNNDRITDTYIRINSKANLIEGCDENYKPTGILYNKFITSGDFFKIPTGKSQLVSVNAKCVKIDYDYLYY